MSIVLYDKSSNVNTADTGSGPSNALWKKINWNALVNDPNQGVTFWDDFADFPSHASASGGAVSGPLGKYGCYIYQGGAIAGVTSGVGGAVAFSSDGDNEGAMINGQAGAFQIVSTAGLHIFEARFKTSTIANTMHGIFCGLMDGGVFGTAVPIQTDGTLADKNLIGFHRPEGTGNTINVVYKASGQTAQTLISGIAVPVADTYLKLGWMFDPTSSAASQVKFFVNGVASTTYLTATQMAAATFPNGVALTPTFGVMNATGTTPGNSTLDWWRGAQLRLT